MLRQRIDDAAIETYINAVKTSDSAAARKQFLKNLLAEADKLGLTVYGQDNLIGHLLLDISIGDSLEINAPGELSLTVMNNCVKIENLKINKFSVADCEMRDSFVNCPQSGLKKFGWRNYSGHNYCSPNDMFDFKLSMLPNWLKKLSETADAIARAKKQIEKTRKIAEIQADMLQGTLEALPSSVQAQLPELKCCIQRFPEQRSFGLWLYNVEVDRPKPSFDDPYKFIFKPGEEYTKFSPDDRVYLETTRRMLDKKKAEARPDVHCRKMRQARSRQNTDQVRIRNLVRLRRSRIQLAVQGSDVSPGFQEASESGSGTNRKLGWRVDRLGNARL